MPHRTVENLLAAWVYVALLSVTAAIGVWTFIAFIRSLALLMLPLAIFAGSLLVLPLVPALIDRSLLRGWETNDATRLRALLLPAPVAFGVGVVVLLFFAPAGALDDGVWIVQLVTAAMVLVWLVVGPRYVVPRDRGPMWHIRRFDCDVRRFEERVQTSAEAFGGLIRESRALITRIVWNDATVVTVRARRKGGVYVRVRDGPGTNRLKRMMEDAAAGAR